MEPTNATSMYNVVSSPLNEHQLIVKKLFETMASMSRPPSDHHLSASVFSTLQSLYGQVLEKDKELMQAVKLLQQHQETQQLLLQLEEEIRIKDQAIYQYASQMRSSEQKLSQTLKQYEHIRTTAEREPTAVSIDPRQVVAYAHRIAGTTSAPSYWKPGLPMFGFMPPAPQEQMMRAGVLSRGVIAEIVTTADLQPEQESSSTTITTKEDLDKRSISTLQVPLGISLSDLDLNKLMPPGWDPNNPITLPKVMVIPQATEEFVQQHNIKVPEHWKPGDPIPFSSVQPLLMKKRPRTQPGTVVENEKKFQKMDDLEHNNSSTSSNDEDSDDEDGEDSEDEDGHGRAQTISLSLSSDDDSD